MNDFLHPTDLWYSVRATRRQKREKRRKRLIKSEGKRERERGEGGKFGCTEKGRVTDFL
jgi:hypothetical protein